MLSKSKEIFKHRNKALPQLDINSAIPDLFQFDQLNAILDKNDISIYALILYTSWSRNSLTLLSHIAENQFPVSIKYVAVLHVNYMDPNCLQLIREFKAMFMDLKYARKLSVKFLLNSSQSNSSVDIYSEFDDSNPMSFPIEKGSGILQLLRNVTKVLEKPPSFLQEIRSQNQSLIFLDDAKIPNQLDIFHQLQRSYSRCLRKGAEQTFVPFHVPSSHEFCDRMKPKLSNLLLPQTNESFLVSLFTCSNIKSLSLPEKYREKNAFMVGLNYSRLLTDSYHFVGKIDPSFPYLFSHYQWKCCQAPSAETDYLSSLNRVYSSNISLLQPTIDSCEANRSLSFHRYLPKGSDDVLLKQYMSDNTKVLIIDFNNDSIYKYSGEITYSQLAQFVDRFHKRLLRASSRVSKRPSTSPMSHNKINELTSHEQLDHILFPHDSLLDSHRMLLFYSPSCGFSSKGKSFYSAFERLFQLINKSKKKKFLFARVNVLDLEVPLSAIPNKVPLNWNEDDGIYSLLVRNNGENSRETENCARNIIRTSNGLSDLNASKEFFLKNISLCYSATVSSLHQIYESNSKHEKKMLGLFLNVESSLDRLNEEWTFFCRLFVPLQGQCARLGNLMRDLGKFRLRIAHKIHQASKTIARCKHLLSLSYSLSDF
ncbi:hypothetical protein Ciccas_005174 [Cichlidogyrus casuarinus]|uniref:Thioredoxin domain-containing protein n=1 Tax=Cichlidogyrus casuarinus TaxID=1844966 RepID=A0ABD2Q9E0_9PLAT